MANATDTTNRRPVATRQRPIAVRIAAGLARRGVTPNVISVMGLLLALAGCGLLVASRWADGWAVAGLLVGAALSVQLRLAANVLDGLVAVEQRRGSPTGPLFNEVPDRLEDVALLLGAGLAVTGSVQGAGAWLGVAAALAAVGTAYVRLLGGALGQPQRFGGPLAKPQRMALLTLGLLACAALRSTGVVLPVTLAVLVVGSAVTAGLRLRRIARDLSRPVVAP